MNSLARAGRVIRAARSDEDVFVLGEGVRRSVPADATLASVAAVLEATDRRADALIEVAEEQAETILAEARAAADAVRAEAYEAGHAAGAARAESEAEAALALIRSAASEGQVIRDQIANQAAGLVARAVSLALRRIVGEYYDADPARTVAACAEALRAAAGQDVVTIRVHPGLVQAVEASLTEAAGYVKPDDAIESGGCIVDLRTGTIDATLDTRLSLMDLALREAGGEVQL
jgi:flagellar biosynthesis/type III secretory pathway protein FliH